MAKQYIAVTAQHNPDGTTKPLSIRWRDGRVYSVDRIMDVRQAASLKAGGCGIRYTCRIHGKQVYLFDEEGKWFIE
ncbi:hypothetical protein HSX37_09535|uniref:Uncharacterized protein n=1 Tax=Dendrosporobacter quercicolus TaxID=146817 RepID=A0A1G9QK67_9FIRM|nr:hypothetical protein [Dendrosporobacter quercicolus]NSL48269.1 hypothetical protein [Dendrosporobacter quercicolus DSM 1736]SDM11251.1 hypothetical protein SAMN04488502_102202 [Dendrosporobacter quercicolus]